MSFASLLHSSLQGQHIHTGGLSCQTLAMPDELEVLSIQREHRDAIFSQRSTTMLTLLTTHTHTGHRIQMAQLAEHVEFNQTEKPELRF